MKLQLCKSIVLIINGPITGKEYVFNGAGSIVKVDDVDGEIMKNKKSNQPCCGGGGPTNYFQVVEEHKLSTSTRSK